MVVDLSWRQLVLLTGNDIICKGSIQWNKLPLSLRSLSNVEIKDSKTIKRQVETFKKDLKTHLFKQKQYFKSEK